MFDEVTRENVTGDGYKYCGKSWIGIYQDKKGDEFSTDVEWDGDILSFKGVICEE